MRSVQIVIILVALGASGAAGLLAMRVLNRPPAPVAGVETAAPRMNTEDVLVASRDISLGAAVTDTAVEWRAWPAEGLSASFITRSARPGAVTELQGTLVRSSFTAGEPIQDDKLIRTDQGFLSAVLPKGMRAAAVRVNAASTAGGFILPDDRVDVIMIRQMANSEVSSDTILANIRVLAIDQSIGKTGEEKQATMVAQDTVTLELTPDQVELITQAQQMGTISLALRSIADAEPEAGAPARQGGVNMVKFGVVSRISARPAN